MADNTAARLREGRLSQLCPACGLVEAAGAYCSACRTPTGEGRWFTNPSHNGAGRSQRPATASGGTGSHPTQTDERAND